MEATTLPRLGSTVRIRSPAPSFFSKNRALKLTSSAAAGRCFAPGNPAGNHLGALPIPAISGTQGQLPKAAGWLSALGRSHVWRCLYVPSLAGMGIGSSRTSQGAEIIHMKSIENAQRPFLLNPASGPPIGLATNKQANMIAASMRKLAGLYLGRPKGKVVVEVGHRGAIVVYPKGRGVRLYICVAAPDEEILLT